MGHYRFYKLTLPPLTAGYSVECGSDAEAMRAARTLLERAAGVEVWTSTNCVAHLSAHTRAELRTRGWQMPGDSDVSELSRSPLCQWLAPFYRIRSVCLYQEALQPLIQ